MQRTLFWQILIIFALSTSQAMGDINCQVVADVQRLHNSLVTIRSLPHDWVLSDHLKVLTHDADRLTETTVLNALNDHQDPKPRITLVAFVRQTRALHQAARTFGAAMLARHLNTPQWHELLAATAAALQSLPCGPQATRHAGDAEGRPAPPNKAPDRDIQERQFTVDNLGEKIAYSSLAVAAATGMSFLAIPLWRRRKLNRRRLAKRFPVSLTSAFHFNDQDIKATIINLSCTGAKVQYWSDSPVAEKTKGDLKIGDQMWPTTVVWGNAFYLGVKFTDPLPIKTVRSLAGDRRYDALGREK